MTRKKSDKNSSRTEELAAEVKTILQEIKDQIGLFGEETAEMVSRTMAMQTILKDKKILNPDDLIAIDRTVMRGLKKYHKDLREDIQNFRRERNKSC